MMFIRLSCVALTLAVVTAGSVAAGPRTNQSGAEPRDGPSLPEWLSAVESHVPGERDASTAAAAGWSKARLDQVMPALRKRLGMNADEESRNQLLRRGALLHMDTAITMSVGPERRTRMPPPLEPSPARRSSMMGLSVRGDDGQFDGLERTGLHWEFGRALLDAIQPRPSLDDTALRWYRAAAAFMANRSEFSDLLVHLEEARTLFPDDPELLYASGCLFEAFGAPRVRAIAESTALPAGVRVYVPSQRDSWQRAESFFRRAIEVMPGHADARVRRARVLHMLGRHQAALMELREAISLTKDPVVRYLAAIFEGGVRETLADTEGARKAYERALTLFPESQAPRLAISRIAAANGDRAGALALTQRAIRPGARDERDDPWWTYHLRHVVHADALFAELRAPFLGGEIAR